MSRKAAVMQSRLHKNLPSSPISPPYPRVARTSSRLGNAFVASTGTAPGTSEKAMSKSIVHTQPDNDMATIESHQAPGINANHALPGAQETHTKPHRLVADPLSHSRVKPSGTPRYEEKQNASPIAVSGRKRFLSPKRHLTKSVRSSQRLASSSKPPLLPSKKAIPARDRPHNPRNTDGAASSGPIDQIKQKTNGGKLSTPTISKARLRISKGSNTVTIPAEDYDKLVKSCSIIEAKYNSLLASGLQSEDRNHLASRFHVLKSKFDSLQNEKEAFVNAIQAMKDSQLMVRGERDELKLQVESLKHRVAALASSVRQAPSGGRLRRRLAFLEQDKLEIDSKFAPIWQVVHSRAGIAFTLDCTESRYTAEGRRVHDWSGLRHEALPNNPVKYGDPILVLQNDIQAVPGCPLTLTRDHKLYTPVDKDVQAVIRRITTHTLATPVGATIREPSLRSNCIAQLSTSKEMISHYRRSRSTAMGNRKRTMRNTYLIELGYSLLVKGHEKKESKLITQQREEELEKAISRLTRYDDDGNLSLSWWRIASFDDLSCYEELHESDEYTVDNEIPVDFLFANEAARAAYRAWVGYAVPQTNGSEGDTSILILARLDAWMTTINFMLSTPSGRGGHRNVKFTKLFGILLPQAVEELTTFVRGLVRKKAPDELVKPCEYFDAIREKRRNGDNSDIDILRNSTRTITHAFFLPSVAMDYVAVTSDFFKANVCSWMGNVKDCYIGRCHPDAIEYISLLRSDVRQETSDSEDGDDVDIEIPPMSPEKDVLTSVGDTHATTHNAHVSVVTRDEEEEPSASFDGMSDTEEE